jgi:arylsulfatase B
MKCRLLVALALYAGCGTAPDSADDDGDDVDAGVLDRPNILLVIADDLGAADVGVYAAEWNNVGSLGAPPTPVMDRLAADGVRFTTAWSNPVCSPTRATLMTGRYGFRTGVGTLVTGQQAQTVGTPLALEETTLAEAIPSGYRAGLFGKWHIGNTAASGYPSPPGAQGFEVHQGILSGALTNYSAWTKDVFIDDGDGVVEAAEVSRVDRTSYVTDELVADASAWIAAQNGPWLAVLAVTAPHSPFHIPPAGTFDVAVDADCTSTLDAARRCYRAMVQSLDTSLGALLDDPALRANTIVIFVGDNGPPSMVAPPGFGAQNKDTVFEGGVRVPLIVAGPTIARGRVVTDPVNLVDLFATIVEATGGDARTGVDSVSLVPYLQLSPAEPLRPWVYTEQFEDDRTDPATAHAALRRGNLKVIEDGTTITGFYDLVAPLEGANLLDPACGGGCACLRPEHASYATACGELVTTLDTLR